MIAVHLTLGTDSPAGLVGAAVSLAERAVLDGWAVDRADGFVYTTDWVGEPVVRARMHWVAAEAVSTAHVLHEVTGEAAWAEAARTWWAYIDRHLGPHDLQLSAWNRAALDRLIDTLRDIRGSLLVDPYLG